MDSLPKLPGLTFNDPTIEKYNLPHTFTLCNGYKLPKHSFSGIGERELDSSSVKFVPKHETVRFDPTLIYGRIKPLPTPKFLPHYALYTQKCLTFKAFFKQITPESAVEIFRIRHVNIIYFLEDDTLTVIEPKIPNSGINQGRLIRRGKIPKNADGDSWHWKDFGVGREYNFYGLVLRTYDCDAFTREYMASQGLNMEDPEEPPADPYLERKMMMQHKYQPEECYHPKFRKYPNYDGKVLSFKTVWDSDCKRKFDIYFFLADNTVSVREIFGRNQGNEYPQLLKKMKLPKNWDDRPLGTFPSEDAEMKYYSIEDFLIGQKIFVFGRPMLIYDCDLFTRQFFKNALSIEQKPPIEVSLKTRKLPTERVIPPHNGIGSLEDSLQNTLTFLPKPPKKDVIKQILNAHKYLRYEMKMESPHPEDANRRFLLFYSLADSTCRIFETRVKNSGFIGGKYLKSIMLAKPNTNPINPDYYSPVDFYIGATIVVFEQRFKIVGVDLHVYKYMEANPTKFPAAVIENIGNYILQQGYLVKCQEYETQDKRDNPPSDETLKHQQQEIDTNLELMDLDIIVPKNQLIDTTNINEKTKSNYQLEKIENEFGKDQAVDFKNCDCQKDVH